MTTDPLYRVYKCRHKDCGGIWVEEAEASKHPRCLVCGGAIPYSSVPMSEQLALAVHCAQRLKGPLHMSLEPIEKASLERLKTRGINERERAKNQMNELRIFYNVLQQGVFK